MPHNSADPAKVQAKGWEAPRLVRLGQIADVAGATKGTKQAGIDNPALIRS